MRSLLVSCLLLACCLASCGAPAERGISAALEQPATNKDEANTNSAVGGESADDPAAEEGPMPEGAAAREPVELPSLWTRMAGVDWPTFLGPTGDSKSPEKGILTRWPKEGPRIVWQKELGIGYGIGSVSRGRFYQFDRFGNRARLYCLNAETGEELWRFEYPTNYEDMYGYNGGPRCSPVVDEDRVYIFGAEGMLHCITAADGKPIWKVDTNGRFGVIQNFFGVGSTPVVEGDLLLAMVGGSPPENRALDRIDLAEGNGSGIVGFDKFTGRVKYQISDELASYASLKTATIGTRRWCFAFCRGGLVGFEPATGKIDFEYPWRARLLESVNASTPVVEGNEVFISETYGPGSSLLAVSPGKHEVVWSDSREREKAMQTHWNTPVYVDGYLYGSSGRHLENAELRCIEWKTGKVTWSVPELTRASLLYVDGHFVCLGETGTLHLFKVNPEKFEVAAEATLVSQEAGPSPFGFGPPRLLKEPCWAAPILSHGLLYVRGKDRLVCLELIPEKDAR